MTTIFIILIVFILAVLIIILENVFRSFTNITNKHTRQLDLFSDSLKALIKKIETDIPLILDRLYAVEQGNQTAHNKLASLEIQVTSIEEDLEEEYIKNSKFEENYRNLQLRVNNLEKEEGD